jgi:hypothetical protein
MDAKNPSEAILETHQASHGYCSNLGRRNESEMAMRLPEGVAMVGPPPDLG